MEPAIKPKRSYRKRKQHPSNSNPLAGVLTRNKSRRYLHHCTRSGKIRPDPVGTSHPSSITLGTPRYNMGVLIKDLRAHRVFSQPLVAVKDENPYFDCKLGEVQNPNLSVLVKCDLDMDNEGLIERNPNFLNVRNPNFACKLGKIENPNFDCQLGETENPNLLNVRTTNFDCKLGEMENPNFSNVQNPNYNCELLEIDNPNLSMLVKCDLDVGFKVNEGLFVRNPNLSNVQNTNFDDRFDYIDEGLNVQNPNFEKFDCEDGGLIEKSSELLEEFEYNDEGSSKQNSILLEKDDSMDCFKGEGMDGRNPNLLENFDLEVDCDEHNLYLLEKCDSVVESKDEGLNGQRHTLLENFDQEVDYKVEGLNEQNCNLLEKCDSVNDLKDEGSNSGNHTFLENFDKEVDCKVDGLNERSPNLLGKCDSVEGGKEEKSVADLACNGSMLDDMSLNLSDKNSNGRKSESSEGLVEVNVQTTPPNVVISLNPTDDCNVVAKGNVASSSPQNQVSQKTNSIPKKTSVLKPCSRPRVFRAINSFSYRRLLPYLMDLANDSSSPLKLDDCSKSEDSDIIKSVVLRSRVRLSVSHESDEKQVTTVPVCEVLEVSTGTNSKEEKELPLDPHLNANILHVSTQIPMDQSHDDGQAYLVSNENQNVNHVSNGSPEGGAPHDKQISTENHEKLDAKPVNESHAAALSEICEESPKAAQENAIVENPCYLSLHSAEECRSLRVECKTKENSISVVHKSSNDEGFVSSSGPIVSLAKGILKKNPRGCRGICDCLNCALFRANAEKAFEFSRNQLVDTEELVQDMMKEIANLCSLLEKSASKTKNLCSIPVNQIQEACSRASNMETIARNRLSQMNEDLYIHCRTKPLHRPRVKFSTDVKEVKEPSKQMHGTPLSKARSRRARPALPSVK